jgi:hypothetical protein
MIDISELNLAFGFVNKIEGIFGLYKI